jgi:phosphoglycerate dehydrogenase-like enzyme
MLTCAILDDYQGVGPTMADWSGLADRITLRDLRTTFATRDALVDAIQDCEIVVMMRERTPFPAELFARLPRLRLLLTSGMRNLSIDLAAAQAHGVTVCGTASHPEPPVELTWALILGLARHLVPEVQALRTGGPWQASVGSDLVAVSAFSVSARRAPASPGSARPSAWRSAPGAPISRASGLRPRGSPSRPPWRRC